MSFRKIDRKNVLFKTVDGVLTPCRMSELSPGDEVTVVMPNGHQTKLTISLQIKLDSKTRAKMHSDLKKRPKMRQRPEGILERKKHDDGDGSRGRKKHDKP